MIKAPPNSKLPMFNPAVAEPKRLRQAQEVVEIQVEIREIAHRQQLRVHNSLTHTVVYDRKGEAIVELQSVEFLVLPHLAWRRVLEALKKLEENE